MEIVNKTPHNVSVTNGEIYKKSSSGSIRIKRSTKEISPHVYKSCGDTVNELPPKVDGVWYIVSARVFDAVDHRRDFICPVTDSKSVVREKNGKIISVPGFISRDESFTI